MLDSCKDIIVTVDPSIVVVDGPFNAVREAPVPTQLPTVYVTFQYCMWELERLYALRARNNREISLLRSLDHTEVDVWVSGECSSKSEFRPTLRS